MSTATALAGTFNADPVHSSFGFAVKYQNVSLFRGTLGDVTASLVDGRLEGTAKVESISIRTPEQFRAHVLSAEFFDVDNHPEVKFVSSDLQLADDGTATVNGDLTERAAEDRDVLVLDGEAEARVNRIGVERAGEGGGGAHDRCPPRTRSLFVADL